MTIQRCDKCGSSLGIHGTNDGRFCLKCSENLVQEKPYDSESLKHNDVSMVAIPWLSDNPVQESVAPGAVSHASSIHPDAGEWEKAFDQVFDDNIGLMGQRQNIKSFIRSQIELAEKRVWEEMSFGSPDWREFVKKIKQDERSRLWKEIGKLRKQNKEAKPEGKEEEIDERAYNAACVDILKVLHEV